MGGGSGVFPLSFSSAAGTGTLSKCCPWRLVCQGLRACHEKGSVTSWTYQAYPVHCVIFQSILVSVFWQSGVTKCRNCYWSTGNVRTCRRMNANSSIPIWWQLSFAWDRLMKLWACLRTRLHKFDSDLIISGTKQTKMEKEESAQNCAPNWINWQVQLQSSISSLKDQDHHFLAFG